MQLSAMDLNLLVALDALLETGSVKKAAQRLALSASATSHTLARLRDLLDDPLLVRSGQKLVLTPRAERLRPRVRALVEDIAEVLAPEPAFDPARLQRTFTIAATDHMSGLVMEPLSRTLAQAAPGVNLYLLPVYRDTMDRLRDGSLDVAMGAFPSHPPDVLAEAVFLDRYVCVLRKGHPALRKRLDVRAYAALEHMLIAPQGVPVGRIDHELRALGHERRVARTVPHFHLAPRIVASSDYVVTMSLRVARDAASRFPLEIVDLPFPLPEYPLKQLWHRRHEADPALAWLRAQIAAIGATLPALDGL